MSDTLEAIATLEDRVENGAMRPDDRRDLRLMLDLISTQAATIAAVRDLANSAGRCGWRISADDIRKTLGKP